MHKVYLLILLLCPALAAAQESADTFGARKAYRSSASMPNGVAFGEFLNLLEATRTSADPDTRDMYWHILADALGYEAHRDADLLRERAELFRSEARRISGERQRIREEVLCRLPGNNERTDEDLHDAVNSLSDISKAIKERHYLVVQSSLTGQERRQLREFLNELKTQTTYTTYDSRIVNDPAISGRDIREAVRAACAKQSKIN